MAFTVGELDVKVRWSKADQKLFATDVANSLKVIEGKLPSLKVGIDSDYLFKQLGKETKALDNVFAVQVRPIIDKSALAKEFADIKSVAKKIDIPVGVDEKKLVSDTTKAVLEAEKIIPKVDLETDIDTTKLVSQLDRAIISSEITAPSVNIKTDIDPTKLFSSLSTAIQSVEKILPEIDLKFGTAGLKPIAAAAGLSTGAVPVAVGAAGAFGLGAAAEGIISGFGVKTAADLETVQVAFEGLLGSAEEAQKFLKELQAFTIATPFDFFEITDSAQKLVSMMRLLGKSPKDVIPMLQVLGDVAAAGGQSEEQISGVIRALGQMSSKSKVSAQDLNQISEQFPNFAVRAAIAEIAAKKWGVTTTEAANMIEEDGFGQLQFASIFDELVKKMQLVPGAAGAMARQFETLTGKWSSFKETFKLGLGTTFTPFIDDLNKAVVALTPFAAGLIPPSVSGFIPNLMEGLIPSIGPIVSMFDSVFAAINPVLKEISNLIVPVTEVVKTFVAGLTDGDFISVLQEVGNAIRSLSDTGLFGTLGEIIGGIVADFAVVVRELDTAGFFTDLGATLRSLLEALQPLTNLFVDLFIAVIPLAIPLLETFTKIVKTIVDFLVENPAVFNSLVIGITAMSTSLFGLLPIITSILPFLSTLGSTIFSIVSAIASSGGITAFFAGLGSSLAGLFAPIAIGAGVLVAVIAALPAMLRVVGVAFEEIKRVVEAFSPVLEFLWNIFKIGFGILRETANLFADWVLIPTLRVLGDVLVWIGDLIKPVFDKLNNFLELFQKDPGGAIKVLLDKLKDFGGFLADIGQKIIDGIPALGGMIVDGLASLGSFIQEGVMNALQWLEENWASILGKILAAPFLAIGAALFGAFKLGELLFNLIKDGVMWLWDNKDEIIGLFIGFLKTVFNFYKHFYTEILPNIISTLVNIGADIISAIIDFIKKIPSLISSAVSFANDVGKAIFSFLADAFFYVVEHVPEILGSFNETLKGIPGKIIDFFIGAFNFAADVGGKIGDFLGRMISAGVDALISGGKWLKDNWLKVIGGLIAVPFAVTFFAFKMSKKLVEIIWGALKAIPGLLVDAGVWLFDNVLQPMFNFIFVTLPTKSIEFGGKFVSFIWDALLALPGLLLNIGQWLWDNVLQPMLNFVFVTLPLKAVDLASSFASMVFDFILKIPSFLADAGQWLWDRIRFVFDAVVDGVSTIIESVVDFFVKLPGRIVDALGDIGSFIWNGISSGFNFVKDNISSWIDSLTNLFKTIGSGIVDGILGALRTLRTGFNSIITGFNWVGNLVGMTGISYIPEFHTGGRVGSDGKMRPMIQRSSDEQLAVLLKDEEVIPREVTRTIPTEAWNRLRSGDIEGFTEAAQVDVNTNKLYTFMEAGGPLDIVKNVLTDPIGSLFDVLRSLKNGLANMLVPAFDGFGDGVAGSLGEMMRRVVNLLKDKVLGFFGVIKDEISSNVSSSFNIENIPVDILDRISRSGGVAGNYNSIIDYMNYTGVPFVTTSTFRPFSITQSGALSYHGMGRAVDFAGPTPSVLSPQLRAIFDALVPLNEIIPGGIKELIYAGAEKNIKNGVFVPPYAVDLHKNHVHFAFADGGLVYPSLGGVRAVLAEAGYPELVVPMGDAKRDRRIDLLDRSGITGEVMGRYHNMAQYSNSSSSNVYKTYNVTQSLPPVSDPGLFESAAVSRLARL